VTAALVCTQIGQSFLEDFFDRDASGFLNVDEEKSL
jgi:hypothetical protein